MEPRYFRSEEEFRKWLEKNHESASELVVGFHKLASGKPSITYPQARDQALCFGWIDGVRRSLGETSYTIRFTRRRARSIWSAVNIDRMKELTRLGQMMPAGVKAFEAREESRSRVYSFENKPKQFDPPFEKKLRSNRKAWEFFEKQIPSYKRTVMFWVMSAKKPETREKRMNELIECSKTGNWIKGFINPRPKK
jgi:uncharacterized protein YdeI (YjbR/CyaY-like superfamily)